MNIRHGRRKMAEKHQIPNNFLKILAHISPAVYFQKLFPIYIFSVFFYMSMEWLFFITKPSFMDGYGFIEKLEVLFTSSFVFFVIGFLTLILTTLLYMFVKQVVARLLISSLGLLFPSIIIAVAVLQLFDNFTYTIFGWGIVSTSGFIRGVYGAAFLFLLFWFLQSNLDKIILTDNPHDSHSRSNWIALGLLSITLIVSLFNLSFDGYQYTGAANQNQQAFPNILLIGSDGMAADHMSVYGYERDTTPFLREFVKTSLLGENVFTNNGNTSGSIVSIYTSKLPTETRVVYPPNSLQDIDRYQHLPGILKSLGYYSEQLTIPFYADANSMGVVNGFDVVNNNLPESDSLAKITQLIPIAHADYFIYSVSSRIVDRLLHIFFIKQMVNPMDVVRDGGTWLTDEERTAEIIHTFQIVDRPIFMHIHFMGTHGARFEIQNPKFSAGEEQSEDWMTDFYDDSILDFDGYLREIVNNLDAIHKLDNTIIIVYSDHYQRYKTTQRIPLIIRFPAGGHAGTIQVNLQNLDIAPTILDYMNQPIPEWMEGAPIIRLQKDPESFRYIFNTASVAPVQAEAGMMEIDSEQIHPPFYQFQYLQALVCDEYYRIDLSNYSWATGKVSSYLGSCSDAERPSVNVIKKALVEKLLEDGFVIPEATLQLMLPGFSPQ
jgi:hypothetical protein